MLRSPRLHAENTFAWMYSGQEGTREGAGQVLCEQHCLSSSLASPKPGGGWGGKQLGDVVEGPGDKEGGTHSLLLGSTSTAGEEGGHGVLDWELGDPHAKPASVTLLQQALKRDQNMPSQNMPLCIQIILS